MAHGTRILTDEDVQRMIKLWNDDPRFGNRYRFARRLAEVLYENQYPSDSQIKAADKRLARAEKGQKELTSPTANAIALAFGMTREELERRLFSPTNDPSEGDQKPYQHFEIIHFYDIADAGGRQTVVRTAEKVKVLKREIITGGSYWESKPENLRAWFKHVKEQQVLSSEDEKSLWRGAIPVEVERVVKTGKIYRWDTHHEPALRSGEVVCLLTAFELTNEFTSAVCRDAFHSMQEIGSFSWRIKFPTQRPAKRWWITVEYHPSLPSNTTLAAGNEKSTMIDWSITGLPKGVVYFINWEW